MRLPGIALLAPALFAQNPSPEQIRSAAARSCVLLQKGTEGFTKAGETPLAQSKKYQYSHIEAALQKAGACE